MAGRQRLQLSREERQQLRRIQSPAQLANLEPRVFERFVTHLYQSAGYQSDLTVLTGGNSFDLHLSRGTHRIIARCYPTLTAIDIEPLAALLGAMQRHDADAATFITAGRFTEAARQFAVGKPLTLTDGNEFITWKERADVPPALGGASARLAGIGAAIGGWWAGLRGRTRSAEIASAESVPYSENRLLGWLAAAVVLLFAFLSLLWASWVAFRPPGTNLGIGGGLSQPTLTATPIPVVQITATPLPTPTATPLPAPTANPLLPAGVPVRNAARVTWTVVLDGDPSEWSAADPSASAEIVHRDTSWDGSNDGTVQWRLGWDDAFLYVVATVEDNVFVAAQSARAAYLGDSLELWLDTQPVPGDDRFSQDETIVLLCLTNPDAPALATYGYLGHPTVDRGFLDVPNLGISGSARRTTVGYVLEAAIPWSALNVTPAADAVLGLALILNDNDQPARQVQAVQYAQVANAVYNRPATWGRLRLAP